MEQKTSKVTVYGSAGHQPVLYLSQQSPPNITYKYLAPQMCFEPVFPHYWHMFILYLPKSHDFIFSKIKLYQYEDKDPKSFQIERKGLPTKEQESGQHQWQKSSSTAFKLWKENHSEPQILYVAKLSFKWEGKTKTHQDFQTLRELVSLTFFVKTFIWEYSLAKWKRNSRKNNAWGLRSKKQWL